MNHPPASVRESGTDWFDTDSLAAKVFSHPDQVLFLRAGSALMRQHAANTRLYYIIAGRFEMRVTDASGSERILLEVGPGELVGVQSVYLHRFVSTNTVIAVEDSEVAWIDLAASRPADLERNLMPVMVEALVRRQEQARAQAERERAAERRQQELEAVSMLGQMAAGVAHELNNALAVIARGSEWVGEVACSLMADRDAIEVDAFGHGFAAGRPLPGTTDSRRAASIRSRTGCDRGAARRLSRLPLDEDLLCRLAKAGGQRLELAERAWELGATLADMAKAARQAQHVVTSMKQLGAQERLRDETTDLHESLRVAAAILDVPLRGVELDWRLEAIPPLRANQGELVQVWSNLLKNACEAMQATRRPPRLVVSAGPSPAGGVRVSVIDNGPGIPDDIRQRIFEPSTTTKKDGLSFGLGLGLSIVQRLVTIYGGRIGVDSSPTGTTFTIDLPREILA